MRKYRMTANIFIAIILVSVVDSSALAGNYVFNSKKTIVRFSYVMGLATQYGRFKTVEGILDLNEQSIENSHVFAKIATASVDTGLPYVDEALKGAEFFNAQAEPALTFESRTVKPTAADAAEITGDITVNGITKPVTLSVTLTPHDDPALKFSPGSKRFVAKTTISRSAFNMKSYADMVGDEIGIEIDAIVRPKS